jgi:predicted transposase YdaD
MKTIIEEMLEDREYELKKQGVLEVARRMRAEGIDVDTVARLTKLTVDDVLRL